MKMPSMIDEEYCQLVNKMARSGDKRAIMIRQQWLINGIILTVGPGIGIIVILVVLFIMR